MSFRSVFPLVGLVVFVIAGCTTQAPASPKTSTQTTAPSSAGLHGTAWRLEDLGGVASIPGVEATLEFPEEGKAVGRGSCNRFFGTVEISGESIQFGPLASTKMACIDAATSAQETKYLEALQAAERIAFDGPALVIYFKGDDQPLRFSRK
jgi:heat shock protein HslJ